MCSDRLPIEQSQIELSDFESGKTRRNVKSKRLDLVNLALIGSKDVDFGFKDTEPEKTGKSHGLLR